MHWRPSFIVAAHAGPVNVVQRTFPNCLALLERKPNVMTIRRSTVEHVLCTLEHWMGPAPFLPRTLGRVSTKMSLQVLAYNLKRVVKILGISRTVIGVRA